MRRRTRTRRSDADDAVADMVEQCKGVLEVELDQADPLQCRGRRACYVDG